MKEKDLKITMFVFAVLLLSPIFALLFWGSSNNKTETPSVVTTTIEYSGCEYFVMSIGNQFSVTHKGNCKYCVR